MKVGVWLGAVLVVLAFFNGREGAGRDVQMLCPVEVLCLYSQDGAAVLMTDSGDVGAGVDFSAAVENMNHHALYEIFFDTAEYLIVSPECLPLLNQAAQYLRPSCVICLMDGLPNMENAAQYLESHQVKTTLQQYRAEPQSLVTLETREGRMRIVRE